MISETLFHNFFLRGVKFSVRVSSLILESFFEHRNLTFAGPLPFGLVLSRLNPFGQKRDSFGVHYKFGDKFIYLLGGGRYPHFETLRFLRLQGVWK